ncbi:MAG: hypothetical protein GY950_09270 [bacterium]|nr:hypothetical protein [bacterium]
MKNVLFKLVLVVVLAGVLLHPSCKKSDDSANSEICFKWEWVQSAGGIAGVVQTPQSEGYTQAIEFDEDGNFTRYTNDAVVSTGTYVIDRAQSDLDDLEYDMILFDGGVPLAVTRVTAGELILREECWDCFTHTYQK